MMEEFPERFADPVEDREDYEGAVSVALKARVDPEPLPDMPPPRVKVLELSVVNPNRLKEKPLGRASSVQFRDLAGVKVDAEILNLVPASLARQLMAVPIELQSGELTVAMIDPEDFDAIQLIRKETGLTVQPILCTRDDLQLVLDQYTGIQAEVQEAIDASDFGITAEDVEGAQSEDMDQTNDNAPTAKIVYTLLKRAIKERASDIHIEPYEHQVVVRFRVDGILQKRVVLPKEVQQAVISRLKILANLKIDEQRLPQDGRLQITFEKRAIDFRFSTIPVVYGEKVVMRILDKSVGIISIEEIGLADRGLEVLKKNSQRSHGMILVTGPTGSGKTTSLYAVLGRLMSEDVNILTLEDPVEYRIESINQSQVHAEIGYTFATGLRAVVRQDPDIVMLGEIRDQETADMAIHAALTGHVVLSTLHTNDAAGAFPRLIDMHIEPFLITSSLHTVIGQRLARKLCTSCTEKIEIAETELDEVREIIKTMPADVREELAKKDLQFAMGKGCDKCGGKGYKGRVGIFEVLDVSEPIRDLVLKRSSGTLITEQAVKDGMVTMVQDGIVKALRHQTSLAEVWRLTRE
jgi:type IV pilus assembly protein PilB